MSNETPLTIIGNLTAAPELRYTQSGLPVANFTVASTPRTFDKQSNEWKDGEPLFMRCSIWRDYAENVAASLDKGYRVIVTGNLKQRSFETREGEKRTVVEMDVNEIGPALRYVTSSIARSNPGQGAPQGNAVPQQGFPQQGAPQQGYQQTPQPQQGFPQQGGFPQQAQPAPQQAQQQAWPAQGQPTYYDEDAPF